MGRLAHRGRGHAEVGERIEGVGIRAVLRDDDLGLKPLGERRQRELQRRQPAQIPSSRIKR
jgi:hypothetical protein